MTAQNDMTSLGSSVATASLLSLAVVAVAVYFSTAAHSLTLKNRDAFEHKITVVEGVTRSEHTLAGQQEITAVCRSVCSLYIDEDPDSYDVVDTDKVEILEGDLYYTQKLGKEKQR